jgi:hypothetical protein
MNDADRAGGGGHPDGRRGYGVGAISARPDAVSPPCSGRQRPWGMLLQPLPPLSPAARQPADSAIFAAEALARSLATSPSPGRTSCEAGSICRDKAPPPCTQPPQRDIGVEVRKRGEGGGSAKESPRVKKGWREEGGLGAQPPW